MCVEKLTNGARQAGDHRGAGADSAGQVLQGLPGAAGPPYQQLQCPEPMQRPRCLLTGGLRVPLWLDFCRLLPARAFPPMHFSCLQLPSSHHFSRITCCILLPLLVGMHMRKLPAALHGALLATVLYCLVNVFCIISALCSAAEKRDRVYKPAMADQCQAHWYIVLAS